MKEGVFKMISPRGQGQGQKITAHEALTMSAKEIRKKIEEHQRLLQHLEDGREMPVPDCSVIGCSHNRTLKTILLEVVEVLENSRKAFKSKELEALRKKLIRVLAEAM
jgi:hypothetical protein